MQSQLWLVVRHVVHVRHHSVTECICVVVGTIHVRRVSVVCRRILAVMVSCLLVVVAVFVVSTVGVARVMLPIVRVGISACGWGLPRRIIRGGRGGVGVFVVRLVLRAWRVMLWLLRRILALGGQQWQWLLFHRRFCFISHYWRVRSRKV